MGRIVRRVGVEHGPANGRGQLGGVDNARRGGHRPAGGVGQPHEQRQNDPVGDVKLQKLKERLEASIMQVPTLEALRDQIRLEMTVDGLSIQIDYEIGRASCRERV